jgi:4-hydroxy-2-oxoglutarate aldolase
MALQAKLGHGDWAASKVGGIGGLKAVISKNFGYGEPHVRGPLKAVNPYHLEEHEYYKTLADLIAIEESIPRDNALF